MAPLPLPLQKATSRGRAEPNSIATTLRVERLKPPAEGGPRERAPGDGAHVPALVLDEPAAGREPELAGEEGVVADRGVGVQGQVARIEGAVARDQGPQPLVGRARQGPRHVPVHAVVDDQEVDARIDRLTEGDEARVDGGADLRSRAPRWPTAGRSCAPGASLNAVRRVRLSQ